MQSADKQVDDTAEKLKELARRQQQDFERQRRAMQSGGGGAGSSDLQRQLAQEADELARRLPSSSLASSRNRTWPMRRGSSRKLPTRCARRPPGPQNSESLARSAMDKIQEAQRKLQQNQTGRAERDVQDALRKAEELVSEQKQVQSEVGGLSGSLTHHARRAPRR